MRTMTASYFRARCLKLMDEVAAGGEAIVITKRGRPVAELLPLDGSEALQIEPERQLFYERALALWGKIRLKTDRDETRGRRRRR
jgi:prevent-host-death family protein